MLRAARREAPTALAAATRSTAHRSPARPRGPCRRASGCASRPRAAAAWGVRLAKRPGSHVARKSPEAGVLQGIWHFRLVFVSLTRPQGPGGDARRADREAVSVP